MNPVNDLGPCGVVFGDGEGTDLGATLGGVIFRHTEESRPVHEDQKGVTEVDGIKVGASCEVEVPLTRTALGILATIIGGSTYTGSILKVGVPIGISLLDNSQKLVLKPLIDNVISEDSGTWLTVFKAYPRADIELVYNNEGQRVYKVIFKAFPNSENLLWQMGA